MARSGDHESRTDWTLAEVEALLAQPFNDLLYRAHAVHRACFDANKVQLSTLLSIKTGGCPEDCAYCPQSVHHGSGLEPEPLMDADEVVARAREARARGATRFCMGAAYRGPKPSQLERICEMIRGVSGLGLETCATLGLLSADQARALAAAGLDYYNHNIDTSPAFYANIISTRSFADRLDTLRHVRAAGMKVCCGGIVGMGESRADRAAMLHALATLPEHPESVPVNRLVAVRGTPLASAPPLDVLELVRTIAAARVLMPRSHVRLSAGREDMDEAAQALAFFAGANSVFFGERLLTTPNPGEDRDRALLARLGLRAEQREAVPGSGG